MNQYLLCTDLDRTLIPNGSQPVSVDALNRFKKLVQREDITLVYVTGRHLALIEQAIIDYHLPKPDFSIADVGSTIYELNSAGWHHWEAWSKHISTDWHGKSAQDLCQLLRSLPLLKQEKEKQNRHKLSFYVPLETDSKKLLKQVNDELTKAGYHSNLIWSIDEAAQIGLLDILPKKANKLHAIQYLMQQKHYTHGHTIFAGDSGNDLDVLLSDINSVLVANAHEEVKAQAAGANKDTLYIARGNFLGMNGNYSAGIIEGAAHFWPEIDNWLHQQF